MRRTKCAGTLSRLWFMYAQSRRTHMLWRLYTDTQIRSTSSSKQLVLHVTFVLTLHITITNMCVFDRHTMWLEHTTVTCSVEDDAVPSHRYLFLLIPLPERSIFRVAMSAWSYSYAQERTCKQACQTQQEDRIRTMHRLRFNYVIYRITDASCRTYPICRVGSAAAAASRGWKNNPLPTCDGACWGGECRS